MSELYNRGKNLPNIFTARLRHLAVAVLFVVVALVQTAPLAMHFTTHVPYGNYPAATTVWWEIWTLWWNSDRLAHGYADYWQAPIFYPNASTFVYSEPQGLSGLVFSVFLWISDSSAVAYNLIVVAILALNGWSGFFLLRRLHVRFGPALMGGVLLELLPIAADQLGVIQTAVLFPCPAMLGCLVQFSRAGGIRPLLGCALWMAACYHLSSHTASLFSPLRVAGFLAMAARKLIERAHLLGVVAAAGLAAILVAPVVVTQVQVLGKLDMDLYRSEAVIRNTSARAGDYLKMPATNWLRQRPADWSGHALGFGVVVWPFCMAGIWFGVRQRRYKRWTLYCLGTTLACVLLSFGPALGEVGSKPYEWLRDYFPGFRYTRNLWRFSGLAQIFVAVLAALGLAQLLRRAGKWRLPLGIVAVAVLMLDWLSAPVPLLDLRPSPQQLEWVQWLRQAPEDTRIVHVPLVASGRADKFEPATYWMYCQMYHGKPMGNGFASFVPIPTKALARLMSGFPDALSITGLRRQKISHVLIESAWYAERAAQFDVWSEHLVLEKVVEKMRIYRVVSSGAGAP